MFTFINVILLLLSGIHLLSLIAGKATNVREIAAHLIDDGGVVRLRSMGILSTLVGIYLVSLTFPLKELNFNLGLAWAVLMLVGAIDSIYTFQKLHTVIAAGDREARYPYHDSPFYLVWQVLYCIGTIGAVLALLFPPGVS